MSTGSTEVGKTAQKNSKYSRPCGGQRFSRPLVSEQLPAQVSQRRPSTCSRTWAWSARRASDFLDAPVPWMYGRMQN